MVDWERWKANAYAAVLLLVFLGLCGVVVYGATQGFEADRGPRATRACGDPAGLLGLHETDCPEPAEYSEDLPPPVVDD